MRIFGKEFKYNGNDVYHKGNKPSPADIGAYTKAEVDARIADGNGTKITTSFTQPSEHVTGQVWIQI